MFLASFFAACTYSHGDHSFGCSQIHAHDGGFIVPLLATLVEEASYMGLARLITLCRSNPVKSLIALKRVLRSTMVTIMESMYRFWLTILRLWRLLTLLLFAQQNVQRQMRRLCWIFLVVGCTG